MTAKGGPYGHGTASRPGGAAVPPSPDARAEPSIAVALHHDRTAGKAPTVVASGRGMVAEQILALAFENGVKVRQDSDLAQILSVIDIDSEIPPEAFAAVAEILAYLYRMNADKAADADPSGAPAGDGLASVAPVAGSVLNALLDPAADPARPPNGQPTNGQPPNGRSPKP